MNRRRAVLAAYLRLPHALPVAIVLLTTAALALAIDRGLAVSRLALMLLAMLGAQLVIGVVNELVDVELDRASRPDKPLVSGLVTPRGARLLLAAGALLMLGAAATLGAAVLALCLLGCAAGVAYSLWFKRTLLASVPYLFALPLLPIWVAVALDAYARVWLLGYPLGSAAILGVHIAQSVPDVAADRAAGIVSLTTRLGERRSLAVCWAVLTGSALIFGLTGIARDPGRIAATLVIAAVVAHAALARLQPRAAIRAAFPVAATSTAALGIAWVLALAS